MARALPVESGRALLYAAEWAAEWIEQLVHLQGVGVSPKQRQEIFRAITQLGLTEAKSLVEAAPKAIKEGVSKAEAEEIKAKVEAAGGTVEIK